MDYVSGAAVPFHVVKGENGKDSRLVSESYNVRIKQDVSAAGAGKKANINLLRKSSDLSGLSSSGDDDDTDKQSSPDKPVMYATLSMKMLQARAEPDDVVQKRVLKRFESENEYQSSSKKNYR